MKPLILELPDHYQRSPQDAELQRVYTELLQETEGDLNDTLEQLFPSTVHGWGLELWELWSGAAPFLLSAAIILLSVLAALAAGKKVKSCENG